MAKQLTDLPEHTRFGFTIREPLYGTLDNVLYKPDPVCGCGCGEKASTGFSYDKEMFASKDCVIRMMITEGWLKEVS